MSRLPEAADLLSAAYDTLTKKIIPALPDGVRYDALMLGNALRIAMREVSAENGDGIASKQERESVLAAAIRRGEHDEDPALVRELRWMTIAKLKISNPKALAALAYPKGLPKQQAAGTVSAQ